MTEHDKAVLREHRRRQVEQARAAHQARAALLDTLTVERFTHAR